MSTGDGGAEVVHSAEMTAEKQPETGKFFITQQQTRWLFNRCDEIRLASVNGGNNNDN